MGCRRNLTRLTLSERQAFVNAVLTLKANGEYDKYIAMHEGAMGHGHGGPAFFPWHREYLRRFEDDLQAIDSSVNLPYWDWTVENLNSAGTASLIWSDDFMGSPGDPARGFAISGPFAGWALRRDDFSINECPGGGGLLQQYGAQLDYTVFRGLEGPHGGVHNWVGGNASNRRRSPQDPVFWLIHANVDRLWAEWTTRHRGQPGWIEYAPTGGGPQGHNLNDTMWPWNGTRDPFGVAPWTVVPENRRPADMLDHRVFDTLYDTVDPFCRFNIRQRAPKALKDAADGKRGIKEVKDQQPLEGKRILRKELLKDRSPKEFKEIRETDFKTVAREGPDLFIPEELRPELSGAALHFEPDVLRLREELEARAAGLQGPGQH